MNMTEKDELYIRRCFSLARRGSSLVKTNPRVGCVIVHNNTIIGEGYHKVYGEAHAEINALRSVLPSHKALLPESTLYVSLEPCHHSGKTPPCVDAIIKHQIKRVVISCLDPNPLTYGKSVRALRKQNIEVVIDILKDEGEETIKEFLVNQSSRRPFVILKWAQSKDGYISKKGEQTWLSNDMSKWVTHRWRSEIDAILVGTDTAIIDNPRLDNRRGFDRSPKRVLLDRQNRVPPDRHIISDAVPTIIFTCKDDYESYGNEVILLPQESWSWDTIWSRLLEMNIGSVMVEGGKKILASLIEEKKWDEARIIHTSAILEAGIKAPSLSGRIKTKNNMTGDTCYILGPNPQDS